MGRYFIEYIEDSLNCKCTSCDTPITAINKIKTLRMITIKGSCSSFTEMINIRIGKEETHGYLHKSSELYMYDFDSCFINMYSGVARELFCNICNKHLGWFQKEISKKEEYIILNDCFY